MVGTRPCVEAGRDGHTLMMSLRIRLASAADVPAMHRLRSSVLENRLTDPRRVSEASYLPYIKAGSAWVAESDTSILGFGAIDRPKATVWALFIDPHTEGRGVGLALHNQMIHWARETGLGGLSLGTEKGTRAETFYKRAGWTEIGTTAGGEVLFEMVL